MKVDRSKLRKPQSELPSNCQQLIQKLKDANDEEMAEILKGIQTWHFGKCELFHWIDVLDKFDTILANVSKHAEGSEWILVYDQLHLKDKDQAKKYKDTISHVLRFTGLLVEHSYARHIYSSMEHLIALLSASDMEVVLCVLNVLYIFSKRSNFISRLPVEQRKILHDKLYCLAESWGGVENGFGLAHCSKDLPMEQFPESASNVHFEFYSDGKKEKEKNKAHDRKISEDPYALNVVHLEGVNKLSESPGEIMEKVLKKHKVPEDKRIKLFSRIRLAKHFHFYTKRIKCLQARLQAISILVYSTSNQENTVNQLLYPGFVEELVDAVRLNDPNSRYADISSASLRTMTAIIHLERNSRLNSIIEVTGANSYHGFLPTLVRNCIQAMTGSKVMSYTHGFATALFSFLYHLASYESGGESLVSCGLMESLLKVIEWPGEEDCITFVTRAVRVVDLITNLDMAGFQNHGGLATVLNRLEREIKQCQPYHGGILSSESTVASPAGSSGSTEAMETSPPAPSASREPSQNSSGSEALMETDGTAASGSGNVADGHASAMDVDDVKSAAGDGCSSPQDFTKHTKSQIIPQRAALLKSILNFFKKAILDPSFSDSVRTVMDGSLPTSLKYIISNVEYYGPALYLLATDVVTVYVFHEPSLLSSLQDKDLTGVVLKSLVVKDIPATREVLAFLPNILSALCLNNRGLQAFMACKPFDKLFKVLLSPDYLPAMRRRRGSDALGDTASSLGTAMDELMRHQPMLKSDAMKAIIKLLQEVCQLGSDPKVTCVKSSKVEPNLHSHTAGHEDEPVSDEEYDEDHLPIHKPDAKEKLPDEQDSASESVADKKKFVPLTDYILNVVRFVDAILSNNSTDDHCREFVRQNGLEPLIKILGLPNLPLDFPSSLACQAIGTVGRSILVLCQEHQLLQQGLQRLTDTLKILEPLSNSLTQSGQSLLLQEVLKCPKPFSAMNSHQQTPLLHAMAATQSYVNMFTYICRAGQTDVRTVCINHWGAELGIETLKKLCQLYSALVWESSVLLLLCTQEHLSDECALLKNDLQKLSDLLDADAPSESTFSDAKMLSGEPISDSPKKVTSAKLRVLKQLLAASSKLGRALAEFFSLLVRLAVGSGQRQRRLQHAVEPSMPTLPARLIASQLAKLLMHGLSWKDPEKCALPRLNLTFYICSLGFVHPMLFDDRKHPYHLMLQQLVSSGGHRALFDRFQWVISRGSEQSRGESSGDAGNALPEGSDEFVNAWLSLMEKLVNPKLIMDSPHSLPAGEGAGAITNSFQPRLFLMSTQKRAFSAVMSLWEHKPLKTYGAYMKQSVLAILCHIIQGEKLLKSNEKATNSEGSGATGGSSTGQSGAAGGGAEGVVNEEHLQQLMDMGFTREHARNALMNTATIEQATEYVLTRAPAPTPGSQLGLSLEMSEEDQMMQAIALSLGEPFPMAVDQPSSAASGETKPAATADGENTPDKGEEQKEVLDSTVIDSFAENMLPGCLLVVSEIPEAVYKACDLIVALSTRNGKEWRNRVIGEILSKLREAAKVLCGLYENLDCKSEGAAEQVAQLSDKPEAALLKSMLHLLSLVLEEMKSSCASLIMESGVLEMLVRLLRVSQKCLLDLKTGGANPPTPSWMTPLLILADLYEKSVEAHIRKVAHDRCTGRVWKWFDDRSGRWHNYSNGNNSTIDVAYRAGESSIRFTAGRRRYVVQFDTMIQVNEDSGNRRPIMLEVITQPAASGNERAKAEETEKEPSSETTPTTLESPVLADEEPQLLHLKDEEKEYLMRSCVSLISIPVEGNALNAVVRLCVRLTRDARLAQVFVDAGGPHRILALKGSSTFDGFSLLITLLLRHVVEDQDTLRHTMEKVIRSAVVSGIGSINSGVGLNSLGTKEINYILRVLSPAAARHPELFKELLLKCLRFALPSQIRRGGPVGNEITIPPNQAVLVNTVPVEKSPKVPKVSENVRSVVYELLHSLCSDPDVSKPSEIVATETEEACRDSQSSSQGPSQSQVGRTLGELGDLLDGRPTPSLVRHLTGESLPSEDIEDMIIDGESSPSQKSLKELEEKRKEIAQKEKKDHDAKPLLDKITILNILSELVKSYSGVAQLIAEYEIQQPMKQVKSQISVLAFIMDYLLPVDASQGPHDPSSRARLLLTVIGACNHSPDAQTILVNEFKEALARTLAMPESLQKHVRLQALFNLVLGIIDSGCGLHQQNSNNTSQQNNTIKLFVKKGVISDLARVSQSLDLSSPNVVATINTLLKPLEKLSNLVNLPPPASASASAGTDKKEGTLATGPSSSIGETRLQSQPTGISPYVGDLVTRSGNDSNHDGEYQRCMTSDLDSGGLHIEGRAVRQEPEDSYMTGSEGESEARNTTESNTVADQPEMNRERVPESDEELLTSPSIDAVVIEIHRETSNESSVDQLGEDGEGGDDEEPSGVDVEVDDHDGEDDEDDDEDEEDEEEDEEDEEEDHTSIVDGEDEELEAEGDIGNDNERADEGVVVESYNGVIMLEDEGEESEGEDHDEDDEDEDDEDEEDGSEIEGNERGLGDHVHDGDHDSDYLFLHLDEPRQGSISRLIREHSHPGAILASSSFRGSSFPSMRSSSASSTTPTFDFSVEHPLLTRQQPSERSTNVSRLSRVRVLRSDRNRRGHMTHIHVHYPHEFTRIGGRLLMDDDIRLITRGAPRGLVDEGFPDIFAEGPPSSNILSDISSALYLWTQESQILDGGGVHHCIASIKKDAMPVLEKDLEAQIEALRETERKKRKEEEAKKAEESTKKEKEKSTEEGQSSDARDVSAQPTTEPMQVESFGDSASVQVETTPENDQGTAESTSVGGDEEQGVVEKQSSAAENSENVPGDASDNVRSMTSTSVSETPTLTSDPTQPSEMHVEPSSGSVSEGLNTGACLVPSRVANVARGEDFVTPTVDSTPPIVCPGAPSRHILEFRTPDIPTPTAQPPVVFPFESENMETGETPADERRSTDAKNNVPAQPSTEAMQVESSGESASVQVSTTPESEQGTAESTSVSGGEEQESPITASGTSEAVTPTSEEAQGAVAPSSLTETFPHVGNEIPETSGESRPATIDGVQIPEGVDPSFLEALPEAIRREVLAEQLALRPSVVAAAAAATTASGPSTSSGGENTGSLNVSPEFLAALPPDVQDEVLQQQRLEQERQRVRTTPPEEPVDPGTFLRNLPPSLRQQILTDMDDSQFSVLPEDLSSQAQTLRREFEARQARLMQERFAFGDSDAASAISALLRRSGFPRRIGRTGRGGLQFSRLLPHASGWGRGPGFASAGGLGKDKKGTVSGRQVLDNEALVCLLILLFVDEPRINVNRLLKVIRNFCYHEETRLWVIQALISVLRRTSGQNPDGSCAEGTTPHSRGKGPGKKSDARTTTKTLEDQLGVTEGTTLSEVPPNGNASWLNMSVDAALGCRARVFNIQKTGKSTAERAGTSITINSQAASFVCKHVVDALACLAKNFPASFTPVQAKTESSCGETRSGASDKSCSDTEPASTKNDTEFWNILMKLDGTYGGKKGKATSKQTALSSVAKSCDFNTAPIGYLMTLLSHPVIRKNATLMDSLLRLLSVVSLSLPDNPSQTKPPASNETSWALTTPADHASATMSSHESQSAVSTGRARTPESVASSLVVETSPRGLEPETENSGLGEVDSVDSGPADVPATQETVNEPMDVEMAAQPAATLEEVGIQDLDSSLSNASDAGSDRSSVVMAPQLRLAVEVLTSGACSEDGLEDATTLLLQVSRLNAKTRDAVLSLLLAGVRDLGHVLQDRISRLLEELRQYNATHGTITPSEQTQKEPLEQVLAFQRLSRPVTSGNSAARLLTEQRFVLGTGTRGGRRRNTGQQRHIRSLTYDLHLPAMAALTEKTSSQNLLLRGLRVILQLRVAARKAAVAAKKREEKEREKEAKEAAPKTSSIPNGSEGTVKAEDKSGDNDGGAGPSHDKEKEDADKKADVLPRLSSQLTLDELWDTLSECLSELARTSDRNAVLVLQPAVEAFFLVHGTEKEDTTSSASQAARGRPAEISRLASIRSIDDMPASPGPPSPGGSLSPTLQSSLLADLPADQQIFLRFAEMHQTVLNHILRQSTTHLADGPFAVLVDHTRFLDFDIKRRYFRHELERLNEGAMRRDDLSMHVRREHVFEDSYRELHRRSPEDLKSRLYVVFEGEEGQDAGGLLREWFMIMSREMFNPNYALFRVSPGDRVTYLPNPSSHCNSNHLSYFKFVGRVVAKAIYDNKLLDAYFTRSFYKHILGTPVKVSDMEAEDYSFYQGLVYLLEHDIDEIGVELTFSTEIEEFGVSEVRDLKPNGRNIPVTEDNKKEYVKLICQEKMTGSIRKQIESFLEGFYEIIPKRLISIFDEQELELLISGLPTIDLDDLKANTEYHKYNENSLQIQWLWRALRSFDQADRAKFLQFVTGTSKVPLQGFAALEGMNGLQKFQIHRDDRSTDRLPAAHTCFNQLDLPAYETYDKLRSFLLKTIHECPEGFGLA